MWTHSQQAQVTYEVSIERSRVQTRVNFIVHFVGGGDVQDVPCAATRLQLLRPHLLVVCGCLREHATDIGTCGVHSVWHRAQQELCALSVGKVLERKGNRRRALLVPRNEGGVAQRHCS
jgi:hypothetical protein